MSNVSVNEVAEKPQVSNIQPASVNGTAPARKPSSLYRAEFWQMGLWSARNLSTAFQFRLATVAGTTYWLLCRRRRETVINNLLPGLQGNRPEARRVSRKLFQNFAQKLVDLWRYESGVAIEDLFGEWTGWDHFERAHQQGRGVLVLTAHIGNWEFGAPLLARRGIKLLVISLEEPDSRLTEMRKAARARWGIETIVIGKDPFAFVEIIRRLESGATIALHIDRPQASSAVEVQLFGRRFAASVAPAELARASGSVMVPVYLPRTPKGYAAHGLPIIDYDRASLRQPSARQQLAQKIITAFEPVIRQNLDQWYHFIPIWPE